MAPGACSTGRTGWAAMPQTARAIGAVKRLQRTEGIPHPPRDSLCPPPHRRKEVQILEPDRSCANSTGHLDVLTIPMQQQGCREDSNQLRINCNEPTAKTEPGIGRGTGFEPGAGLWSAARPEVDGS